MPVPSFDTVRDIPLPTDTELVPHLQSLLDRAVRHQIWVMLLDADAKPLSIVLPSDLGPEADPDEIDGLADWLRCLSYDFQTATIVLTMERPGPAELVAADRRWLRVLREALVATRCPYRGPYVLLGREVRAVPVADYGDEPWLRSPDDDGGSFF